VALFDGYDVEQILRDAMRGFDDIGKRRIQRESSNASLSFGAAADGSDLAQSLVSPVSHGIAAIQASPHTHPAE
jgi:hypothetical protein